MVIAVLSTLQYCSWVCGDCGVTGRQSLYRSWCRMSLDSSSLASRSIQSRMVPGTTAASSLRTCHTPTGSENSSSVTPSWSMMRETVSNCLSLQNWTPHIHKINICTCINNSSVLMFDFLGFIYSSLLGLSTICGPNLGCRFRTGACLHNRENTDQLFQLFVVALPQ